MHHLHHNKGCQEEQSQLQSQSQSQSQLPWNGYVASIVCYEKNRILGSAHLVWEVRSPKPHFDHELVGASSRGQTERKGPPCKI